MKSGQPRGLFSLRICWKIEGTISWSSLEQEVLGKAKQLQISKLGVDSNLIHILTIFIFKLNSREQEEVVM